MLELDVRESKKTDELQISIRCKNCQRDFPISYLQAPFEEGDDVATTCKHCGTELYFGDYIKWRYPHRKVCEQIQYHDLTESEVQAHLQQLGARLSDAASMELYLCGSEASLTVSKHRLQTKSDRLSVLFRTSSIGSERLSELRSHLEAEGCELRLRFSPKRKILNQISVLLQIDDPLMSTKAANLITTVAQKLNCPEPLSFIAGYVLGEDEPGLPGRKKRRLYPYVFGGITGFVVGCFVGLVTTLFWH